MKAISYIPGQQVNILNKTISGKPVFEGIATLVRFVGKGDYPPYFETWLVKFPNDKELYQRTIAPY